jgi:hypothetical protein
LAIIAIVSASNCSRIPENNDPIIGIWNRVELNAEEDISHQEWIFNDAYLGRYHLYIDNSLEIKTDFSWSQEKGKYTISYPGTDMTDDVVSMKMEQSIEVLEDNQGKILAQRE